MSMIFWVGEVEENLWNQFSQNQSGVKTRRRTECRGFLSNQSHMFANMLVAHIRDHQQKMELCLRPFLLRIYRKHTRWQQEGSKHKFVQIHFELE